MIRLDHIKKHKQKKWNELILIEHSSSLRIGPIRARQKGDDGKCPRIMRSRRIETFYILQVIESIKKALYDNT